MFGTGGAQVQSHSVTVPVTWGDVDPAQIVFHPKFFYWIDYACMEWLRSVDRHPTDVAARDGVYLLIIEANAQFLRPAYLDDQLRLTVELTDIAAKTFRLDIKVHRVRDEELLVVAHQRRAYVRYHPDNVKKAEAIPAGFFT